MTPRWSSICRLTAAFAGGIVVRAPADAAAETREIEALYAPVRVERAALAPDGRHVAFAVREGGEWRIAIRNLEHADALVRTPFASPAVALRFFRWATPDRLIVATDAPEVAAIEADTGATTVLADDTTILAGAPRWDVLGLAHDPDGVVLAVSRPAAPGVLLGAFRIDLLSGKSQEVFAKKLAASGGALLADRQGVPRVWWTRGASPRRFFVSVGSDGKDGKPLDRVVEGKPLAAFQVTARNFAGERAFPLGFDDDPNVLYFASNIGRDTDGIYALDVRTGKRTGFAVEDPDFDLADSNAPFAESPLVFDRARRTLAGIRWTGLEAGTRWLDAEIGGVQQAVDKKFPDRHAELLEWDEARARFLVLVSADSDPGRYFIFHRRDGRCVEYFLRAALNPDDANRVEPFAFEATGRARVTGYLTWPRAPARGRPPLVVWFHDGPWQRVMPGFQRDAQALAAMGFAVAEINYRGSAGFGRRYRDAIRAAYDRVPVDDALAVVAGLGARLGFDRDRVVVAGEGFGGYLALRAVELEPRVFRGAVAIDAPLEPGRSWRAEQEADRRQRAVERRIAAGVQATQAGSILGGFAERGAEGPESPRESGPSDGGSRRHGEAPPGPVAPESGAAETLFDGGRREEFSVIAQADRLTRPVLLLNEPRSERAPIGPARQLCAALERRKQTAELIEISPRVARGAGADRAAAFRRIGAFLEATLRDAGGGGR